MILLRQLATKKILNEVGGMNIALPNEVADRMKELLKGYNKK